VGIVVAYALERDELLVAGSACVLLVGSGLLIARARRPRLEVERDFGREVAAVGRPREVVVRIRNAGRRASPAVRVVDRIPWRERQEPLALDSIPATARRREIELGYTLHPPRRGRFEIGPLVVEHEDWFGFARERLELGGTHTLLVVPELVALAGEVLRPAQGDGAEILARSVVAGRDDDLSTREYRPGDALRRVHWRASARHGELMVRQEEAHSTTVARLLVDTRADGYPDLGPAGTSAHFEWVVRMTGSLALHLDALGYRVSFAESGAGSDDDTQLAALDGVGDALARSRTLLLSLAEIRPVDVDAEEGEARAEPTADDEPGPVFAVLGDPAPATLDWLVTHRAPGSQPVAFLAAGATHAAARLHETGWTIVRYEPDAPLDAAWRLVPDAR